MVHGGNGNGEKKVTTVMTMGMSLVRMTVLTWVMKMLMTILMTIHNTNKNCCDSWDENENNNYVDMVM